VRAYEYPKDGDECGPGGPALQQGEEQLESLIAEAADLCHFLLTGIRALNNKLYISDKDFTGRTGIGI
jgi:hypothetical protein